MKTNIKLLNEVYKYAHADVLSVANVLRDVTEKKLKRIAKKQSSYNDKLLKKIKKLANELEIELKKPNISAKDSGYNMEKTLNIKDEEEHNRKLCKVLVNEIKMRLNQLSELLHEHEDAHEKIIALTKNYKLNLEFFLGGLHYVL